MANKHIKNMFNFISDQRNASQVHSEIQFYTDLIGKHYEA